MSSKQTPAICSVLLLAMLASVPLSSVPLFGADRSDAETAEAAATPDTPSWTLQYRFRKGQTFHFRARSNSTMKVSAAGITQVLQENRETYKHFQVVSVNEDGSAVLEPMIDRTIMKARSDGKPWIVWDSRSTQKVPTRFQTVAKNIGKPTVRVRYKPDGEVEEVVTAPGSDEAKERTKRPVKRNGKKEKDLNADKSSYAFLVRLPDQPVQIGDSWADDFVVQVSAQPTLARKLKKDIDIRRIYKLQKVENGIAEIAFDTFVKKPIRDPIIEAQLISRSLSGTVKFELKRGIILDWASAGSGEVHNPYGNSTFIRSGLSSREVYSSKPLASLKPVIASGPPSAAGPPRRPKF